ncbi:MAG TPA: Rieske 2Fe-2S domain-containing protein [Candidatus Dormibacteraeota bacterium]|nr:Rieske 2Fe-2S domain-containing protein [Candidatus Dormibacteraeota bacterium]
MNKPENRIDKIVSDLLRGRRLKVGGGDAEEKAAITAAARLAAARQGPQRMSPAFRKRLARLLEDAPSEGWITRRAALVAGLGLAAGAATGGLVGRALEPAHVAVASGGPIKPKGGSWIDVAALADLVEGQGKHVKAGSVGAFVFRHGDNVTAVSSICSHLPCELWWNGGTAHLDCPCHPASFTIDGRSTDTQYPLPSLNTVYARVTSAGRVEVLGTA